MTDAENVISTTQSALTGRIETLPGLIDPSRAASVLLWSIGLCTVTMLLWAALVKVDEVAQAHGRVIPSQQLQVVSNLEGGIVQAILVKPGQAVTAGQELIKLDRTQFTAEYGRGSGSYDALVARAARLQALASGKSLVFPDGLATRAPAAAATERSVYSAQLADLAAQTGVVSAKLEQAQRALGQAKVDATTRAQGQTLADRELAMIAPLVAKGIEPQVEQLRAQSAVDQARGARASADLAVRRAGSGVSEAQAELRGVRDRFRAQAIEQLTLTHGELAQQAPTLPALQDRVTRTEVRAPISGTVNRVLVATVGGTVRPGEPLVEIVPKGDTLVIEAEVKPADIAFIHKGQKAFIKLSAYDYSVYGGMDGVVDRISPDATIDEKTGESHFTIQVRTTGKQLRSADGMVLPIGAGMQAEVDVLGHKRSVLSYVLTPVTKLRDNAFREK
jgi:adhesin transport system membrane fusion protein